MVGGGARDKASLPTTGWEIEEVVVDEVPMLYWSYAHKMVDFLDFTKKKKIQAVIIILK